MKSALQALPKTAVVFGGMSIYGALEGDRLVFWGMFSIAAIAALLRLSGKAFSNRSHIEFSIASLICACAFVIGGYPKSFEDMGDPAVLATLGFLVVLHVVNFSLNRLRALATPLASLMFVGYLYHRNPYLESALASPLESWLVFLLAWELLSSYLFSRKPGPSMVDLGASLALVFIFYGKSAQFPVALAVSGAIVGAYLFSRIRGGFPEKANDKISASFESRYLLNSNRGAMLSIFRLAAFAFIAMGAAIWAALGLLREVPMIASLDTETRPYILEKRSNAFVTLSRKVESPRQLETSTRPIKSSDPNDSWNSPDRDNTANSNSAADTPKRKVIVRLDPDADESGEEYRGFNAPMDAEPAPSRETVGIASQPAIRISAPSLNISLPLPTYANSSDAAEEEPNSPLEDSIDFSLEGLEGELDDEPLFATSPKQGATATPIPTYRENDESPSPNRSRPRARQQPVPETSVGISNSVYFSNSVNARFNDTPLFEVYLPEDVTRPPRLYLRLDALGALGPQQFARAVQTKKRSTFPLREGWNALPESLHPSDSGGKGVWTIAMNAGWRSGLPIPGPFQAIRLPPGFSGSIDRHRLSIEGPVSDAPFAFQISGLNPADTWKIDDAAMPDARTLLELPLASSEQTYLKRLSNRIAKRYESRADFAKAAVEYLARKHAYETEFSIKPGKEHVLVRWLKTGSPGICGYYAGAFTLLARAQGIPARVVTGAVTTEYKRADRKFVVRTRNAHAWAEFLDEHNRWIQVDPTPVAQNDIRFAPSEQSPELYARNISKALEQLRSLNSKSAIESALQALGSSVDRLEISQPQPATNDSDERRAVPSALAVLDSALSQVDLPSVSVPEKAVVSTESVPQEQLNAVRAEETNAAVGIHQIDAQEDLPSANPASGTGELSLKLPENPLPAFNPNERFRQGLQYILGGLAICFALSQVFALLRPTRGHERPPVQMRNAYQSRLDRLLVEIENRLEGSEDPNRVDWVSLRGEALRLRYGPICEANEVKDLRKRFKSLLRQA